MKPFWEITPKRPGVPGCHRLVPGDAGYFRGGGFSSRFKTRGEMPVTMSRLNMIDGLGPALQIAEGWAVDIDEEIHDILDQRTNFTWPTTWFVPRLADNPRFRDVYSVMANWGANHGAIGYGHFGRGPDHAGEHAAHPGLHAQRTGGAGLPAERLERLWDGLRGERLSRLRELWAVVQGLSRGAGYAREAGADLRMGRPLFLVA